MYVVLFSAVTDFAFGSQENAHSQSENMVFDLGEIIITSPAWKQEKTNSVETITQEQISEISARNIPEALEYSPGVDSRIGGRGEARLNIRGLQQRQILIMVDGVPYTEPYNNILDLNRLTTANIAKIEVIKGAPSVLYGPFSLGGVVNIVSSKPQGREFLTSAEIEETGRLMAGLKAGDKKGRHYYLLSLRRESSMGYDLSEDYSPARNEDGGRRENSDFSVLDSELKIGGATRIGGDWALTIGRRQNNFGIPPIDSDNAPRRYRYDNYDQSNMHILYRFPAGNRGEVDFSGLISHYYDSYQDFFSDITYTNPLYYYSTENDGKNIRLSYTRFPVGSGPEIEMRGIFKHDSLLLISGRNGPGSAPPSIEDYDIATACLAAEARWKPGENSYSVVGISINSFSNTDGPDKTNIDVTAGVTRDFNNRLGASFSTGLKTRFPTPREMYEPARGNPDLDPERAVILTAETYYNTGHRKITLGLFRNRISSLIAETELGDGSKYNMNISNAVISGMEFSFFTNISKPLDVWMNYTYLNAMDKTPETDRDRIQYMPVWKLNYGLSWQASRWLSFSLNGSHVGRQYYYYSSGIRQQLSAFEVMSVRAQYLFDGKTKLYAGVRNLSDENYMERHGAPLTGRALYIGVETSL